MAGYLGGLLLMVTAFLVVLLDREVGQLLDPIGGIAIAGDDLTNGWTPTEPNTRLIALEGSWLSNRLLWIGIAVGTLALTHFLFRFSHQPAATWWSRMASPADLP